MTPTYTIRHVEPGMNTYSLLITIDGDWIADQMQIGTELTASDLHDFADKTYCLYALALRRIYKEMESAICMELHPNSLMHMECDKNDIPIDIDELYHEYFMIRKNKWLADKSNFIGQPA